MIPLPWISFAVIVIVATIYFLVRSREFSKFLAGSFFMTSGILAYMYFAEVSMPLLGTTFIHTPEIAGKRSIAHFIFFGITFYRGFVMKPKKPSAK